MPTKSPRDLAREDQSILARVRNAEDALTCRRSMQERTGRFVDDTLETLEFLRACRAYFSSFDSFSEAEETLAWEAQRAGHMDREAA